jgi:hypothetical protein
MLLNRSVLNLAKLASKEASRYSLQAIAIEKDQAIVTDGHIMVKVQSAPVADDLFPAVAGLEHRTFQNGDQVLVHRDAALAALKAIPKKTTIPVLCNAAMGTDGKLYTTDLENVGQFKHEVTGQFPRWRDVMPKADAPVTATIAFNARKMIQLCQYMVENGDARQPKVKLTVYDAQSAMKLEGKTADGQDVIMILMPVRI